MPTLRPPCVPRRRAAALLASGLLAGCAEASSLYAPASEITGAATAVLVRHGVCASVRDCTDRGMAVYQADWSDLVTVKVYGAERPEVAQEVVQAAARVFLAHPRRPDVRLELRGPAPGRPDRPWVVLHEVEFRRTRPRWYE